MIEYDDLPEEIKLKYSRETYNLMIPILEQWQEYVKKIQQAFKQLAIALKPILKRFSEVYEKLIADMEKKEEAKVLLNLKPKYMPYKPKIKPVRVYKKTIHHHIRNNC